MKKHDGLWRIARIVTGAIRRLDHLNAPTAPHIKRELTVWEFSILKSIWCQPGLWPDWHPDTQRLQRLGFVTLLSGNLVLTRQGIDTVRVAGASRSAPPRP